MGNPAVQDHDRLRRLRLRRRCAEGREEDKAQQETGRHLGPRRVRGFRREKACSYQSSDWLSHILDSWIPKSSGSCDSWSRNANRGRDFHRGAAIEITRRDFSASDLRRAASRGSDGRQACRLLALAMVLEGRPREAAAGEQGYGSSNAWRSGPPIRRRRDRRACLATEFRARGLSGAEEREELKKLVVAGPDPAVHHGVRWRCQDLQTEVLERFGVAVHVSTIGRWLHELGLTRLQPRPTHPKKKPGAEDDFKKIPEPPERDAAFLQRKRKAGALVSRRSAGRAEGNACVHLGSGGIATCDGPRQPPYIRIYIWGDLP